jgi:hypothetical protein
MKKLERCTWPALACLLISTAHADSTGRHSVMLSAQGDENDNRQWLSKLVLPLGEYAWVQGSIGNTELATAPATSTRTVGAAIGVGGQTVQAAVAFVRRTGDAQFEQQDWAASLDWRGTRGSLGADVFLRSATGESQTTTQSGGVFSPPVATTFRESVDSIGFGLHGDFDLTPRVKVFAGAMRYRHDFSVESTATGTAPPLSSLLGTPAALSGVWRDQAFIDRSYRAGGSYRFQRAAVSAQYFHDLIANTDETLGTTQLQAELLIGEHWLVSPTIGYSSGGRAEPTGYGGLSVGFTW